MPQPTSLVYNPITEVSSLLDNMGRIKQCRPLALQYARCQDAYGAPHYQLKCQAEYEDVMECTHSTLQNARARAIRMQRLKLYREGKLKQQYIKPPPDAISQSHGSEE